jgi:tetratricopeptide (TPR) repeat protein
MNVEMPSCPVHFWPFVSSRKAILFTVSAVVFWFPTVDSVQAQNLLDEKYLEAVNKCSGAIYRLDYDEAVELITENVHRFPGHPGPPLARAAAIWLRELFVRQQFDLNNFISPSHFTRDIERQMPEADRQAFFRDVQESKRLAELYLEKHPDDKEGRYYLGAVESALAVFTFTIEHSYIKALKHGRKAYHIQKAIVEEDPEFYDAYMTVGAYEYILGNLPWYIKWIAAIAGLKGNEQRGFEYLILAAEKSPFISKEARMLLMVFYVREKEYAYGLQIAQQMHRRYPENFLFHLNQAQILEKMGAPEAAAMTYMGVVRYAEEGRGSYTKIPLGTFRYAVGEKLRKLGKFEQALALFDRATRDPKTPESEKALSHLRAGELLDLLGKREEAIAQYKEVQKLENFEGTHDRASRRMKKRYRQE